MNQTVKNNIDYVLKNILTKHKEEDLKIHTLTKDKTFIEQEQELSTLYFILDGRLKVTANYENGTSILISFMNGFYIVGDIEYTTRSNATCQVDTLTDITYLEISFEEADLFYRTSHDFQNYLLGYLSKKLLQSTNRLQFFNVYSLSTKLSSYIYTISNYGQEQVITLPHLQDLSENLITSYRHLLRTLKELEEKNIIKRSLHKVTILDIKKLKELSRGNIYEEQFNEKEL